MTWRRWARRVRGVVGGGGMGTGARTTLRGGPERCVAAVVTCERETGRSGGLRTPWAQRYVTDLPLSVGRARRGRETASFGRGSLGIFVGKVIWVFE